MRYRLPEGMVLDLPRACLVRGDGELRLKPKAFDTLVYLVEQRGRLVRKQELLETIWKDVYVTENVLVQAIADVRQALGDSPSEPRFIKTVPRRGYMFIAPVEVEAEGLAATAAQDAVNRATTQLSLSATDKQRELHSSAKAKAHSARARNQVVLAAGVIGFALALSSLGALWYVQQRPVEQSSVKRPEAHERPRERSSEKGPEAHAWLGTQALQQGNYQQGIEHLHAALRDNPDDAATRRLLAQALLVADRYPEAARVLQDHPATANDTGLLGVIAWAAGDHETAKTYFLRLIEVERRDSTAASPAFSPAEPPFGEVLLTSFYLSLGDWDQAEAACQNAMKNMAAPVLNPVGPKCHYLLWLIARRRGDHQRADQEIRETLRLAERRLRARALVALPEEAGNSTPPSNSRNETQPLPGRFSEALPVSVAAQLPEVERMIKRGETARAIDSLGGLLARYPRADGAIVRAAQLRLGQLYEERGQIEAAREQYERVVQHRGRLFLDEVMPAGVGAVTEYLQPAEAALKRLGAK
jgi:DNA-binding winged helix-turn-helix (wHTH) protein/Tfp pilus assembly protein PilF